MSSWTEWHPITSDRNPAAGALLDRKGGALIRTPPGKAVLDPPHPCRILTPRRGIVRTCIEESQKRLGDFPPGNRKH